MLTAARRSLGQVQVDVVDPRGGPLRAAHFGVVRWSEGFSKGRYSEAGLKLALLGHEAYPSHKPLGRGLLSCPQFGALKYLSGGERRLGESIEGLCGSQQLERVVVTSAAPAEAGAQANSRYLSLVLTEGSRRRLSGLAGAVQASPGEV